MEKLPVKLNELSLLMNLLIEKIQLLESALFTKQQKLEFAKEMVEVVDNLRMYFEKAVAFVKGENIKNFKEKIERAFSQFEWNTNVAVCPYEFKKFSENGKLLISSILKLLGIKGCGILIIETYIQLCFKILTEMRQKVENIDFSTNKSNFKLFLEGFFLTANALKKYWHIAFSLNQKNTIILCLNQICKVLPLVLKMIKLQNPDIKRYALNIIKQSLEKVQSAIHNEEISKSSTYGQEFIMHMDFCIFKLDELSNYSKDFLSFIQKADATVEVLKPAIDEILCLVMSVAQVTNFQDDFTAIVAGSERVLKDFYNLIKEIKEENVYAIQLNANNVGESLCNLEHKVNLAVLKLVMEVFSGVNSPLKNILNRCRIDIAKNNKDSEDLNVLISDFDSDMDKIMQIGFFAISCTTSLNRILRIQSCLASLESLETELIPLLTALYIECNEKNKTNFQYLFDFWLNEITELKNLIDSVIDPAGFCGVIKTQIKKLGLVFKEGLSPSDLCLNKLKYNLKFVVRYSRKLIRTLKTSAKDDNEINKETEDYLKEFQFAVQECEAVLDLLDVGQDTNKTMGQAVKRYDFLVQTLDKLSSHLFLLVTDEETKCEIESSTNLTVASELYFPKKNYYKLCELTELSRTPCNVIPEILTPYINTPEILRSKRKNILCTAPQQTDQVENRFTPQARYWDKTPVCSKRSRCCKPLTLNLELENTIDLEMTTILENISHLSNTVRSSSSQAEDQTKGENKKCEQKSSRDVACGIEKGIDDTKPVYTSSGCCTLNLEDKEKKKNQKENAKDESNLLGRKLRSDFLQTLNDLSCNDEFLVATDGEAKSQIDSMDRISDIKIVEEKINFLKDRMPCLLP